MVIPYSMYMVYDDVKARWDTLNSNFVSTRLVMGSLNKIINKLRGLADMLRDA